MPRCTLLPGNWGRGPLLSNDATESLTALRRLSVLDGWRGLSILLVLLCHLAPLGGIGNTSIGILGMVIFFVLSGYLITSFLLAKTASLSEFAIRRFFRVVPLAWLYFVIVFVFQTETVGTWLANFLFYANLPPQRIRLATDHMWSLCVEVQFYVGIALLVGLMRRKGLLLLPLIGLLFTILRVHAEAYASSVSWYRVDEILAGCTLALMLHGQFGRAGEAIVSWMRIAPQWLLFVLLAVCSLYPINEGQWTSYFRPYVGALLVGATMVNGSTTLTSFLDRRPLLYLGSISYAVYVVHMGLVYTWLGSGDVIERYSKRPLLLLVLLVLAHVSTFWFEHPMIECGKRLALRFKRNALPATASPTP